MSIEYQTIRPLNNLETNKSFKDLVHTDSKVETCCNYLFFIYFVYLIIIFFIILIYGSFYMGTIQKWYNILCLFTLILTIVMVTIGYIKFFVKKN